MRPWVLLIPISIFFLFHLTLPTSLPIFNDEAIYLHWGNSLVSNISNPRIPLSLDGKQALTPITFGLAQKLPIDPLVASRLVNLIFPLLTLISVMWIAKELGLSAILAGLMLATSPLLLFFDRLALPDSAVTASYIASFALLLSLLKRPKLGNAISLGLVIAFGWWYKSTALLAIPSIVLATTVVVIKNQHQTRVLLFTFVSIIVSLIVSLGLMQLPFLHRIAQVGDTKHIFTVAQLLSFPWRAWMHNFVKTLEAILLAGSPIAVFLVLKPFARPPLARVMWIWFLTPLVSFLFLSRAVDLRYLTLVVPPFILLVTSGLEKLRKWKYALFALIVGLNGLFTLTLIREPTRFYTLLSPLSSVQKDIGQYVTGWPSGWGVREAANFLRLQATGGTSVVFVRNDSGNPEDAVFVYLYREKNIKVLPLTHETIKIAESLHWRSYYFVSRGNQFGGIRAPLTELARFPKPLDSEFVGVYKLHF